jgi:thiamine-monophosphate kinase
MKPRGELQLVSQIRVLAGLPSHRELLRGIGDDCAILRPLRGRDLVFTTDFLLQDRHFTLETHSPADVGYKALARSLSDLAAMGATPVFCLVSLALPDVLARKFAPAFYRGLLSLARKHSIDLSGGDLAKFDEVIADVMCCGTVPTGKAFLRSAARAGDSIYVTGTLGESALGFRTRSGPSWKRHLRPRPRLATAAALRKFGVRCAMDLSDGISLDLMRLCSESKVAAELTSPLPIARGASLDDALHGGEDYELLFTASPKHRIPAAVEGVPITRIGRIASAARPEIILDGARLAAKGFDHFA